MHVKSAWLELGGRPVIRHQRRNANVKPKDEGTIKYDYVNMWKNAKSTIFMQVHRHAQSYSVLQSPFTRLSSTLEGQVPFKARTYHPNFWETMTTVTICRYLKCILVLVWPQIKNWISHGFIGVNKQGQRSIELGKDSHTPESRLDVGGGINLAPGKLGKINKCRPP